MMRSNLILGAVLALAACGDGKADAVRQEQQAAPPAPPRQTAQVLELEAFELPLAVGLPEVDKPIEGTDSLYAQALWVEEFGHMLVRAGDRFALTIAEEPGDIQRLKADMERDMLQKHTVVEETPNLVIYRSEFPDSPDLVFMHFYKVVRALDREFVVEDAGQTRFNEADIRFMADAVYPLYPQ